MTTGEKLVELSSLSTGTAKEHLMHIMQTITPVSLSGGGGIMESPIDEEGILELLNAELDITTELNVPELDLDTDLDIETEIDL